VFSDQSLGRPNLAVVKTVILRQFDNGLKPEFRFPVRVVHVYVESGFLAREEKEPESILAKKFTGSRAILPAPNVPLQPRTAPLRASVASSG